MAIDCPGHCRKEEAPSIKDTFIILAKQRDYEGLAGTMRRAPEQALEHYDVISGADPDLAQKLSPYFTTTSHYTLDDAEIKNRLAMAAILPQTSRAFGKKMDALIEKLNPAPLDGALETSHLRGRRLFYPDGSMAQPV